MKYKILEEVSIRGLAREVNKHLEEGWVCVGGVGYGINELAHSTTYLQALTFEEPRPKTYMRGGPQ